MVACNLEVRRTSSRGSRLLIAGLAVAALVAVVAGFIVGYALRFPPTVTASGGNQQVTLDLETVAAVSDAIEYPRPDDPHPDWVSYLPTTIWKVPANSVVTVTIHQEDGASGLRNPYWAKARGIVGGTFHMKYFDDKGDPQEGDFTGIDDPTAAGHTFAIPDLGVSVPLLGVSDAAPAGSANVITFSFRTGKAGIYRFQCFVPCGAGSIYGNGNAMQTIGYMGGFLVVQ
jgi:uncharacterized protein YaiE (UPF0345 family)